LITASACGLAASAHAAIALREIATNLTAPILVQSLPGAKGDLVIGEQTGVARVLKADGQWDATPFADLRAKLTELRPNFDERGLLDLAFHPQAVANGRVFITYSAPLRAGPPTNWNHTMHLSEFKLAKGGRSVDPASERVVLRVDEPSFNHNGGRMGFGPDGLLYIGCGDGGEGNDKGIGHAPEGNGQNKDTLLGKILRLDVDRKDAGLEYGIPRDNPFAQGGGRAEIYAWGNRNPWGLSFDRGGQRELFEAEVGQSMWEEVNIIERGGNYGWRLREAFVAFDPENPIKPPENLPTKAADGTPLRDPIVAYMNAKGHPTATGIKGTSITGGYVYRGQALPALTGKYIFADWSVFPGVGSGILLAATRPASGKGPWSLEQLEVPGIGPRLGFIPALGEDADGELYVCLNPKNGPNGTGGKVLKLVPAK
jgi:glucose/arabinose dehydrogenase